MFKIFRRKTSRAPVPAAPPLLRAMLVGAPLPSPPDEIDGLVRQMMIAKWNRNRNRCAVCGLWTADLALPDYWTVTTAVYACDLHYHLVSPWIFKGESQERSS